MNAMPPALPDLDPQLLTAARRALVAHDFRVREAELPTARELSWLVAENENFILGVAAARTLDDLRVLEGHVAAALGELLKNPALGPKRWDAYAVLLASTDAEKRGTREVLSLEYNTRALRRVVSLGVTEDAVAEALGPFFALPEPPEGGLPSPFDELIEQLVVNGLDRHRATHAVDYYRANGVLEDA